MAEKPISDLTPAVAASIDNLRHSQTLMIGMLALIAVVFGGVTFFYANQVGMLAGRVDGLYKDVGDVKAGLGRVEGRLLVVENRLTAIETRLDKLIETTERIENHVQTGALLGVFGGNRAMASNAAQIKSLKDWAALNVYFTEALPEHTPIFIFSPDPDAQGRLNAVLRSPE